MTGWEQKYIEVRKAEGFLFSDDDVLSLPSRPRTDKNVDLWRIREHSADQLLQYVQNSKAHRILDLGCGNGWFTNKLVKAMPDREIEGWDVNKTELAQARRVFNLASTFHYVDIFGKEISCQFDTIILNSVFQYFSDARKTLCRLQQLLSEGGEIHIVDTPFYTKKTVSAARSRTQNYYTELGFPMMTEHYFHHCYEDIGDMDFSILYAPTNWLNKIKRKAGRPLSPFPWLCLTKQSIR